MALLHNNNTRIFYENPTLSPSSVRSLSGRMSISAPRAQARSTRLYLHKNSKCLLWHWKYNMIQFDQTPKSPNPARSVWPVSRLATSAAQPTGLPSNNRNMGEPFLVSGSCKLQENQSPELTCLLHRKLWITSLGVCGTDEKVGYRFSKNQNQMPFRSGFVHGGH